MPKKAIKRIIAKKKDSVVKIIAPKVVTAFANIMRLGPRMIFRSTMELLRANLLTRILSCATLLVVDIADLARKRISAVQFVKNVILSGMLIVSGTLGWNFGARWIVLEFFGGFVEIAGGIIGAAAMSFLSNFLLDRASGKLIETDAQKMWKILDPHIEKMPAQVQEHAREQVTSACLKKMYASKNREAFAADLAKKLAANEKVEGVLRAERHEA